jgi:hypothetical protein
MRTRTKNPDGFIDGARRDRCAIVAEQEVVKPKVSAEAAGSDIGRF